MRTKKGEVNLRGRANLLSAQSEKGSELIIYLTFRGF